MVSATKNSLVGPYSANFWVEKSHRPYHLSELSLCAVKFFLSFQKRIVQKLRYIFSKLRFLNRVKRLGYKSKYNVFGMEPHHWSQYVYNL